MRISEKVIFFIITTLILGTITFLIINNLNKENGIVDIENKSTEAIVEEIDYEKYMELRSKAHETENYAILIWNSSENVSKQYMDEIIVAFENRKSIIYTMDFNKLNREDLSRVIDDVAAIMGYQNVTIIIPTTIIMSKGEVVYSHAGLKFKEELIDNLNAKSIE